MTLVMELVVPKDKAVTIGSWNTQRSQLAFSPYLFSEFTWEFWS
jgi:hypothetical protein